MCHIDILVLKKIRCAIARLVLPTLCLSSRVAKRPLQVRGQFRSLEFAQQPNQTKREVVNKAGQIIQPAERFIRTIQQNRVANQQQLAADPVQEDEQVN